MTVDELKAELKKRGIDFDPTAKKADLEALIATDDAKKGDGKTPSQDDPANGGNTTPENDAGKQSSDALKAGKADKKSGTKDKGGFEVICAIADGRRRAGRRWPGGATPVKADELNKGQMAALEADPMFSFNYPK